MVSMNHNYENVRRLAAGGWEKVCDTASGVS